MAFKKMEENGILPGPRAVLICGNSAASHNSIRNFLKDWGYSDIEVLGCREDFLNNTIEHVLTNPSKAELIQAEKLPPVMLWSGISHKELDSILSRFNETGLARPIFATTTTHNLKFTVKELLRHLLEEQKSMREAQQQKS